MSSVINNLLVNLNNVGRVFWQYSVSAFIQSSVLIILLMIIDFILKRHVRAVFRYCVWMLVFIKLVLPPSFSLPTGIGYWCGGFEKGSAMLSLDDGRGAPEEGRQKMDEGRVTSDETASVATSRLEPSDVVPAPAALSTELTASSLPQRSPMVYTPITWQAVVFILWLVGVLVFSVLLIQRVFFVRGLIAQSSPAEGRLIEVLEMCRQQLGLRRGIQIRLSDNTSSPAVCGLFRPIILMPKAILDKLSPDNLRAVLVHELAHIKRGDLWVNLVQTILQVIYFYNPFVWLTNVVVRRIREQAVDEMVVVALGAEAKSYSNTLIDIAEMAFWKANFSLRLIGVAESKKALQGRVKHILTMPIPKSAKLGFWGLLTVVVIAAVLLPMAAAENRGQKPALSGAEGTDDRVKKQFSATLPNGVMVELIGLCEHPSEGKQWWRPNGSTLPDAPYKKTNSYADPNDKNDRQIAVRFSGYQTDEIQRVWRNIPEAIEGSIAHGSALIDGKMFPDFEVVTASFSENKNTATISLGVASGVWQTCAITSGDKEVNITDGDKVVRFEKANEKEGKSHLTVWHNYYDASFRLSAVDVLGNSKIGREFEGGIGKGIEGYRYEFDIPTKEIRDFRFQTRPYQWVTFKNVSLQPGVKTDVQVEIGGQPDANQVPAAMVGTWFFDNPLGDDEQMAVFPDGQVVVLYSNGHKDQTQFIDGFIELAEYGGIKCKMTVQENGTLVQYFNYAETEQFAKRWNRIDTQPRTNLLRPLTSTSGSQSKTEVLKQIETITDVLIKAFNAGDIDTILSYYTDDAVSLPDQHEAAIGKGALHKLHLEAIQEGAKIYSLKGLEQQIWDCGDFVFEAGQCVASMKSPKLRYLLSDWRKSVTVWVKQPDGSLKVKLDSWNPDVIPDVNVVPEPAKPVVTVVEGSTSSDSNMEAMYTQIKQKESTFHKAFIDRDAEAAIKFYADDAIIMSWGKDAVRGKANISSEIKKSMSEEPLVDMTQHVVHIEGNDQMLFAVNLFSWTFKDKSSGQNVTFPGKGVHVWKRQKDGSWKILLDLYNMNVPMQQ